MASLRLAAERHRFLGFLQLRSPLKTPSHRQTIFAGESPKVMPLPLVTLPCIEPRLFVRVRHLTHPDDPGLPSSTPIHF
jgi:hypothetical protein